MIRDNHSRILWLRKIKQFDVREQCGPNTLLLLLIDSDYVWLSFGEKFVHLIEYGVNELGGH